MNKQDICLDHLHKLKINPECTQRELSQEMGVGLGKLNYCMEKLTEKGGVKLTNFGHNFNKLGYMYLRTPKGIDQKIMLSDSFLKKSWTSLR